MKAAARLRTASTVITTCAGQQNQSALISTSGEPPNQQKKTESHVDVTFSNENFMKDKFEVATERQRTPEEIAVMRFVYFCFKVLVGAITILLIGLLYRLLRIVIGI